MNRRVVAAGSVLVIVGVGIYFGFSQVEKPVEPTVEPRTGAPAVQPMRIGGLRPAISNRVAIDSNMDREVALGENEFPAEVLAEMEVVEVLYVGMDERVHQGQIVVHRELAEEVEQIFKDIFRERFPIEKVVPIVDYGWDDDASVRANNTSGFNYREVLRPDGTATGRLSEHSNGRAIDLNPWLNPYLDAEGNGVSIYDETVRGTLTADSVPVRVFKKYGWTWGGDWNGVKDYQHFQKPAEAEEGS